MPAGCGEGIVEVGSNSDEVIESQRGRGAGRCFHVGHVRAGHFVADCSVRRGSAAREMEVAAAALVRQCMRWPCR